MKVLVAQSCLTLWDPMDCSPPASSVHGILQAGIMEWVAISYSGGSSRPRDRTRVSYISLHLQAGSLPLAPHGKPRVPAQGVENVLQLDSTDGCVALLM